MLSYSQIERLKKSWGEKASSLSCKAEVRVYDPLSFWQCYIFALNPENEDEIECIIKTGRNEFPSVEKWTISEIKSLFNSEGEAVIVDQEYRPIMAAQIFKKLNEGIL